MAIFRIGGLITVSYIITNYEQSNFSVFQSKFEDGVKPNIVAISLASTESHISRTTNIGVSIGVIAFFSLSLIAVISVLKKKKEKKRRDHHNGERLHDTIESMELQKESIQEITVNSLIGPHRELPDSGKAELSGSSEPVAHELVEPFAPVAHLLMTHRTSDERPMTQIHDARNKYKIFVSNNITRKSWTSIGTSTDIPCVETTICSQKPKTIDVDRSFTATPISESLQVSPVTENFSRVITTKTGSVAFVERSAAVKSVCGIMGQVPPHTRLHASQRGLARSKYASVGMEIVIPPGLSEVEAAIIEPLNIYKRNGRSRGNFF